MLLYLVPALIAIAVGTLVYLAGQLVPAESEVVRRLRQMPGVGGASTIHQKRREFQRERLGRLLTTLGARMQTPAERQSKTRKQLVAAGYFGPNAMAIFQGARVASTVVLGALFLLAAPLVVGALELSGAMGALVAVWGAALGWVAPAMVVGAQARARQQEIFRVLPDALDLLVVCVEAGLGLNQALQRVADEIAVLSRVLGEQMGLMNMEMRAGVPREEALRAFADRTDLDDVRSFSTMLIQTDRFGTSVASALRIHSDTLRTKRRQRVEEASAKTAIKMLFPLVFCIFPALFMVILGPGLITALQVLAGF